MHAIYSAPSRKKQSKAHVWSSIGFYGLLAVGVGLNYIPQKPAEDIDVSWRPAQGFLYTTQTAAQAYDSRGLIQDASYREIVDTANWKVITKGLSAAGRLDLVEGHNNTMTYQVNAACLTMAAYLAASHGDDRITAAQTLQKNSMGAQSACEAFNDPTVVTEIAYKQIIGEMHVDDQLWQEAQIVAMQVLDGALTDPEVEQKRQKQSNNVFAWLNKTRNV